LSKEGIVERFAEKKEGRKSKSYNLRVKQSLGNILDNVIQRIMLLFYLSKQGLEYWGD
jgi:hypothetical protein